MIALPETVECPLLLHGDCLDLLATLPAESVDVVITDPPAGVGFMGKPWDSFAGYQPRTTKGRGVETRLAGLLAPWAVGFVAFLTDVWSEVDRVLKPGGLVCAWALPKTADLAGLAMRSVGWTICESLLHLFGEGMSKAGDLGKKIDKRRAPDPRLREWCRWLRAEMDMRSISAGAIADRFGFHSRMVDHWAARDTDSQPSMPRLDQIPGLLDVLGLDALPDSIRQIAIDLNEAKGQPGEAWWLREVTGTRFDAATAAGSRTVPMLTGSGVIVDSLPATPEAERWTDWSSQLAPGHEQWLIARKPTPLTYAKQVLTHGCGAINIGACRVPRGQGERAQREAAASGGSGLARGVVYGEANSAPTYTMGQGGSWPKNVVLTEGGEHCPVAMLDEQSGVQRDGVAVKRNLPAEGGRPGITAIHSGTKRGADQTFGSSGGASRFFTRFRYEAKNSDRRAGLRSDIRNEHATPKSVDLMRWLVRLLAAKAEHTGGLPAVVLDPFMGSGTTGVACVAEQVRFVGIERDRDSFEVARARILAAIGSPEAAREANDVAPDGSQLSLL